MSTIEKRLQKVFGHVLDIEGETFDRNASLEDDLQLSPAQVTDLFAAIEQEFAITIPTTETEHLSTVGALIDFIEDATDEL